MMNFWGRLRVVLLLVLCLDSCSFAIAEPNSDETGIRNLLKQYELAYNSGNASALAGLWTTDGDLFSLSGGIFRGQKEILTFFSESLAKNYKDSQFHMGLDQVRFLTPNLAIVDGKWQITGGDLPKGYPSSGIYTQIMIRVDASWRIVAARPSVPLQGHTGTHGRGG
ncbi:MAG: SgcJ/EcaC family oxidoreductase [Candidatus Riflebacteria bacterium]|nr:SgcJ/EcaC family oxidoreductase [Candidatus Riflebacteria bacterium]